MELPVIDISALHGDDARSRARVASEIGAACRKHGFFYASGHGIDLGLIEKLGVLAHEFFALPQTEKNEIAMKHGGLAWRGYFPLGGELTSGKPDFKEGLYFGTELGADDARVRRHLPLHGSNLFPARPKELGPVVTDYMAAATEAAHLILEGIALSLDLEADYFHRHYTADPTVLFRIFRYPSFDASNDIWGVGEHTDYGLLTLLLQDDAGGLQVKTLEGWIDAPPVAETVVCNIGDMLDRLTAGHYKSTPHRARNTSGRDRLSFPLFFDPAFDAKIISLPERAHTGMDDSAHRWDGLNVHGFAGTYGDYLLSKVSKVFPELSREVVL